MLAQEGAHVVHVARDQRRRTALGEPGRIHLLVHVAQPLRPVEDEGALFSGAIQYVSAVDVFHVERRILAHQDGIVFAQFGRRPRNALEPRSQIVEHLKRRETPPSHPIPQIQILLFGVEQLPATGLCRDQDGQRAVLRRLDAFDGVHDHYETNAGRHVRSFSKNFTERRHCSLAHVGAPDSREPRRSHPGLFGKL